MMLMKNYRMIFIQSLTVQLVTIVFINWGLNSTAREEEEEAEFAFIASK